MAHAGMIPPDSNDLDPDLNTVHTLVAVDEGGRWKISLFQSTPAAWHQHPEAREALTQELRGLPPRSERSWPSLRRSIGASSGSATTLTAAPCGSRTKKRRSPTARR